MRYYKLLNVIAIHFESIGILRIRGGCLTLLDDSVWKCTYKRIEGTSCPLVPFPYLASQIDGP